MKSSAHIDRIDRAILHELQLDGRLSNSALAERVNLSESACLRRVRALEESGFLRGYVGLVDQSSAGYPDNVFVRITEDWLSVGSMRYSIRLIYQWVVEIGCQSLRL